MRALGGNQIPIARGFGYFTGRSPTMEEHRALQDALEAVRQGPENKAKVPNGGLLCGVILASPAFQRC